jgi:ribonuclease D
MGFLSDVAALARAGYTPSQIRELMEFEKGNKDQKPEEANATEGAAETAPKEVAQPEQQNNEQQPAPAEGPSLEELQAKITKLEADLAAAQQANVNKPLNPAEEKSAQDYLNELARSFM